MKPEPKITTNELWSALEKARGEVLRPREDPIPGNTFTLDEYAEQIRKHRNTARKELEELVVAGKIKKTTLNRIATDGSLRRQIFFTLTMPSEKGKRDGIQ